MRRYRFIALALVALGVSGCTFGLPEGASRQGREISDLWSTFMSVATVIALIVYGLIVWSIVRYRRRRHDGDGDLGRQFHANIPLEVVYTVIPVLIVIGLFLLSLRTDDRVVALTDKPDVVLDAEAFSWGWRFTYPQLGVQVVSPPSAPGAAVPDIYLPIDETIRVNLSSRDVIHAFWVPSFNFKRDAIPSNPTSFDLTPVEEGTFRGVCAEYCGLNHAFMGFTVHVVDRQSFDAWVGQTSAGGTG